MNPTNMEKLKLAQFKYISNSQDSLGVEFLRRNYIDLNWCNTSGYSYLHVAAQNLDLASINELIKHKVDLVKQSNDDKETPLHIVSCSMENQKFDNDTTILDYVGKLKRNKYVETLLSAQIEIGNSVNPKRKDGTSHLHIACMYNNAEAVKLFLNAGEPVDHATNENHELRGYTALHFAVRYSALEAAECLLKYGADMHLKNSAGKSALHFLIERLMDIADFLVTGKRIYIPFYKQERNILECMVMLFLKNIKAEDVVDDTGLTLLHLTCLIQDSSAFKNVLKPSVNLNTAVNSESNLWPAWTPLHFAACLSINTFKILLQNGADLNIKNKEGKTPLDFCMERYSTDVVYSILSAKEELKAIVFTDGITNILETILLMSNNELFKVWFETLENFDLTVPLDSPIWPGYNLLHLAILNERIKINERKKMIFESHVSFLMTRAQLGLMEHWEEIMYCLLKKNHNFMTENADGLLPIYFAFKLNKTRSVEMLLKVLKVNDEHSNGLSYFHIACAIDNKKRMEKLFRQGVDINDPVKIDFELYIKFLGDTILVHIPAGSTPLHIAVLTESNSVVEYLLNNNADMYCKNERGLDPIHLSMIHSYFIVKTFLKKMVESKEFVASDNLHCLHIAAIHDDGEAIEKILKEGVSSEIPFNPENPELKLKYSDEIGKTPLHIALSFENYEAAEALLKWGDKILYSSDDNSKKLLNWSIKLGHHKDDIIYSRLKQEKLDSIEPIDESGITMLHIACENQDLDWAKNLLRRGADPNACVTSTDELKSYLDGSTPLDAAAECMRGWSDKQEDKIELLQSLIQHGADVTIKNIEDQTPIHLLYYVAMDKFQYDSYEGGESIMSLIDVLLKGQKTYQINPIDSHGLSHFHLACWTSNLEIVKNFLECGVDVNDTYDPFAKIEYYAGFTSLHFALEKKHLDVSKLLIEYGANVKIEDLRGDTPIHVALKETFVVAEVIELILRHGGDINAKNLRGVTPLEYFVSFNFTLEQLNMVLDHGAAIDLKAEQPLGYGIIGLALLYAKPIARLDVFRRMIKACDVKSLIQQGCNIIDSVVNVEQKGELTFELYLDVIDELVDAGCELDLQDQEGKTALHRATCLYNYGAVKALVYAGANLNIIDKKGEHPITKTAINDEDSLRRNVTLSFLAIQIWKMRNVGINVIERTKKAASQFFDFFASLDNPINYDTVKALSLSELNKIRDTYINKLSLERFLSESDAVILYARMPEFERQAIDDFFKGRKDLRKNFQQWAGVLMMQYRKAVARTMMLKPSTEVIFSAGIKLPALCLDEIVQNLNFDELKLLVEGT